MDLFTDCFKLKIYFVIRKTKDQQSVLGKNAAAFKIILHPLFCGMLCSI